MGSRTLGRITPISISLAAVHLLPNVKLDGRRVHGKTAKCVLYVVGASRTVPLPMLVSSSACSYLHCVFPLSGYILVGRYYIRVNWICVGGKSSHYRYLYIQGSHSRQWLGLVNLELGSREKGFIWRLTASDQWPVP